MSIEHLSEHYNAVLADLEQRKTERSKLLEDLESRTKQLRHEIDGLEGAITAIRRECPAPATSEHTVALVEDTALKARYTKMSMRWAILAMLSEHVTYPIGRAEIAKRLMEGGASFGGENFLSNVSAVLSQMANKHEVRQVDKTWMITVQGEETWEGIKKSENYQERMCSAA